MFKPSINFAKSQLKRKEFAVCIVFVSGVGETMGVLQFGIRKLPDFGAVLGELVCSA